MMKFWVFMNKERRRAESALQTAFNHARLVWRINTAWLQGCLAPLSACGPQCQVSACGLDDQTNSHIHKGKKKVQQELIRTDKVTSCKWRFKLVLYREFGRRAQRRPIRLWVHNIRRLSTVNAAFVVSGNKAGQKETLLALPFCTCISEIAMNEVWPTQSFVFSSKSLSVHADVGEKDES